MLGFLYGFGAVFNPDFLQEFPLIILVVYMVHYHLNCNTTYNNFLDLQ